MYQKKQVTIPTRDTKTGNHPQQGELSLTKLDAPTAANRMELAVSRARQRVQYQPPSNSCMRIAVS